MLSWGNGYGAMGWKGTNLWRKLVHKNIGAHGEGGVWKFLERERVCVCNAANSKIIVGSMKPSLVGQKLVRKDLIMS